jgi:hypothetical protein|nr:MAG TPA: hypothetical protein [Caudoviricetes sp.]
MTYQQILIMVDNACTTVFYSGSRGREEKIIECATQIYIAQMKEKENK